MIMNHPKDGMFHDFELLRQTDGSPLLFASTTRDKTYLARDLILRRQVLLRVLNPEFSLNAQAHDAFLDEVRAQAAIFHSNIPAVLRIVNATSACYCAMEYPGGESLKQLIARLGPMDPDSATNIICQSAKVLSEIWQAGYLMPRLNSSVIFVAYEGDDLIVRFPDLRLLKRLEGDPAKRGIARTGDDLKSEGRHARCIDIWSNIKSLGLVFSELLAGKEITNPDVLRNLRSERPEIADFRKLPEKVLVLLEQMVSGDVSEKIQTPRELRTIVERCREGGALGSSLPTETELAKIGAGEIQDALLSEFVILNTAEQSGAYFEAEGRKEGGAFMIHLFDSETSPLEAARCAEIARKISLHPHPQITAVARIHMEGKRPFIACERIDGFGLLEMMRKRRRLPLGDALPIIEQLSSAADHALGFEISGLDFSFSSVRIVCGEDQLQTKMPDWLRLPVGRWPKFDVKIPFYGSTPKFTPEEMGFLPESVGESKEAILGDYLRGIAAITHELLGGVRPKGLTFNEKNYVPLASLTEQGNLILKRCLFIKGSSPFPSVKEFVEALKQSSRDTGFTKAVLSVVPERKPGASHPSPRSPSPLQSKVTHPESKRGSGPPIMAVLLLTVALAIGSLVCFWWMRQSDMPSMVRDALAHFTKGNSSSSASTDPMQSNASMITPSQQFQSAVVAPPPVQEPSPYQDFSSPTPLALQSNVNTSVQPKSNAQASSSSNDMVIPPQPISSPAIPIPSPEAEFIPREYAAKGDTNLSESPLIQPSLTNATGSPTPGPTPVNDSKSSP
jgi:hypothetical protein